MLTSATTITAFSVDSIDDCLLTLHRNAYTKWSEVAGGAVERSFIKQSRCCGDSIIEPSEGGTVCIKSCHHLPMQSFENGGSNALLLRWPNYIHAPRKYTDQRKRWTFSGHKTVCKRCRLVPGVDKGSEDIEVLPNGLAFITSGMESQNPGKIFLFDFKKPRRGVRALDIIGDFDRSTFSPLGLNIWRDNCNVIYIFVVNAIGNGEETVQKFRFDENRRKLYLMRTYRDPTFTHPNDIAVTGEDSFYFTNFFQFDFKEEYLRGLSIGDAGFYDGTRGHILLRGLSSPNGINISPDGKYVYMSELAGKRLNVYHRESDNTLTRTQVVPLEILVDNIDVDVVTGHLWVAGHTDGQALLNHMPPPHKAISPSLALRLTLSEDSKVTDIAEVYYDDGRQLSGASVAVHYRRHMLVGSVFTTLVLCENTTIGDEDEITFIKMAAVGLIDPYDESVELED
ncbi:Serum paraoxonase/arylesterase 1 [Lamellibrachia satsuma]|nr:Serum paraoxonase/arylesterase 1 [Lamellibrachia satsuma]